MERSFKELRARLANRLFDSLGALERAVIRAVRPWRDKPQHLSQLTFYPGGREARQAIRTL